MNALTPMQVRAQAQQRKRQRAARAVAPAAHPEVARCADDLIYFLRTYVRIYDATEKVWIPFDLWPAQEDAARAIHEHLLTILLKSRQLGLTWLVLGYALWLALFHGAAAITLFSRRDTEAVYLLGNERLRGMYARLPAFLKVHTPVKSNDHEWELSNGSIVRAFPTTAGDSYTVTLAIVDEADLVPDLGRLMGAVKPTIDGGGKMVLLSRSDKGKPNSEFKRIYRGAKSGASSWHPVFLPWHVRPSRDEAWYAAQRDDIVARTGSLDDLHEQYPATDTEALAPRTLDKRIPAAWLEACYRAQVGTNPLGIPGLVVYAAPSPGHAYVLGIDTAEGNPTSDDSAITVLDAATGEEAALIKGKIQPSALALYADQVARWYYGAPALVERNNHGHAVLLWLGANSPIRRLDGLDGRPGWLSNQLGKALLYTAMADAVRDRQTTIHTFETYLQLASIDGSTLRAPEGELDDCADSYALAVVARERAARPDDSDDESDDPPLRISTY